MPEKDFVDSILGQWKKERPDLDASPMAVLGRVSRLESHVDRLVTEEFSRYGLGRGEFDVLATLRRSGTPFRLNPKVLSSRLMLSSGAMTNRLDNLESRGLIRRIPDPSDRRALLIELTATGREVIDEVVTAHVENLGRVVGVLTARERKELAGLLRKVLVAVEEGVGR
jgi:DNA-binding MarR family transcriptional regulator